MVAIQTEALIELVEVSKTYKMGGSEVLALRKVSLSIAQGEFVAIMGPSGSGKSTLMNILGCLDRPQSGTYRLNSQDVSSLGPNQLAEIRNLTIGFVFQNFNLLARTSARMNVELPLLYANVGGHQRKIRAQKALAQVGLTDRLEHQPNQLSGGQQQRVALARALVINPKVILADEPTGNLDSQTSLEIMTVLQSLGQAGLTIALVTHEPDIAAFASRVITMRDGRIQSDRRQTPVLLKQAAAQISPEQNA